MSRTWRRHSKRSRGTAAAKSFGSPGDWQAVRNRMCRDKKSYSLPGKAEAAARTIAEKGNGPWMRAYECPMCGRWHLTTKPLYS